MESMTDLMEGIEVALQMLRDMREKQDTDLKEQRGYVQAMKTRSARDEQVIAERDKTIVELKAEIETLRTRHEKTAVAYEGLKKDHDSVIQAAKFNRKQLMVLADQCGFTINWS